MRHDARAWCEPVRRPILLSLAAAAMLLAQAAVSSAQATGAGDAMNVRLFGTNEIRSTNLSKFEKWNGMLERYYGQEAQNELQQCAPSQFNPCHTARWRIFLHQLRDTPPRQQLDAVNEYLNKWPYITDPVNWGKPDYWTTPGQFFAKAGDCEDYAIAKYVSLLHLGFDRSQLRIVVLQDENLKVPHAVLAVYLDDDVFILDNQIPQVVPSSRINHYRPIYSINEASWWLHRG